MNPGILGFFLFYFVLTTPENSTKSWISSSCNNRTFHFSVHAASFTSISTEGAFHLPGSVCVQCRWLCPRPPVTCGTQRCDEMGAERSALGGQGLHVRGSQQWWQVSKAPRCNWEPRHYQPTPGSCSVVFVHPSPRAAVCPQDAPRPPACPGAPALHCAMDTDPSLATGQGDGVVHDSW